MTGFEAGWGVAAGGAVFDAAFDVVREAFVVTGRAAARVEVFFVVLVAEALVAAAVFAVFLVAAFFVVLFLAAVVRVVLRDFAVARWRVVPAVEAFFAAVVRGREVLRVAAFAAVFFAGAGAARRVVAVFLAFGDVLDDREDVRLDAPAVVAEPAARVAVRRLGAGVTFRFAMSSSVGKMRPV